MSQWIVQRLSDDHYFLGFRGEEPIFDPDQLYVVPDFQMLLLIRQNLVDLGESFKLRRMKIAIRAKEVGFGRSTKSTKRKGRWHRTKRRIKN